MKQLLILGAVLIVIMTLALFFIKKPAESAVVGDSLLVSTFISNGEAHESVLLQVPFVRSLDATTKLSITIDTNRDGAFDASEQLITDVPSRPAADWRNGYYVTPARAIESGMQARVSLGGVDHDIPVVTKTVDVGALHDLASVTDPENATKGFGSVAYAQGDIELTQEGIPDLSQRPGECAPTAAANSLISLVDRYGGEDLIPGDPQDFIENLKRHMNWTPENGVPPDDFVEGKNRWAAAAGVPIRTTKVGDTQGISTLDAIREALENGDAVELRIRLANREGTAVLGGHMVTVTGIHVDGDETYLEINDPKTPDSGSELIEIRQNQVIGYGLWRGIVLLSWGFVQTWEGHPTGELLDTMTDEEIEGIRQLVGDEPMITVIEYNGKYLPTSQLTVQDEIGCGADHWHAARGGAVTATDGTVVPDPGPQCGYGKVSELPSKNIPAPDRNTPADEIDIEVRGLESLRTQ